MIASVQKWGNSLGLRIPKPTAQSLGIEPGSRVKIVVHKGRLVITPAVRYALDDLLKGITPKNRHGETETGKRVGREVW